jgi:Na+-transporting NADH:ubiquinone oxidoreductase subunit C
MNRDSNAYTFLFSAIMVFIVAASLAATATSLQDIQAENVRKEKMQNILATIGVIVEREKAPEVYTKYIIEELSLLSDGTIDRGVDAFKLKLNLEIKKPINQQRFPLYLAEVDSSQYYIVPLRGSGLWDAIWGYVALEGDRSTIKGAVFDHKGETAGLGAEITQKWFQDSFTGEKVLNQNGDLVGINVSKTNNDPDGNDKDDNEVDAISGATITGDGVTDMIKERLQNYLSYFNSKKQKIAYIN